MTTTTGRRLPKPPWPEWVGSGADDTSSYPAGSQPYSGTPRIVTPTSGEQNAGLVPGKPTIGAQHHNWLFSRWSGITNVMLHGLMQNWRMVVLPSSTRGVQMISRMQWPVDTASPIEIQKRMLVALAINGSTNFQPYLSAGGHQWEAGTQNTTISITAAGRTGDICAEYPGRIVIVGRDDRDIAYTTTADLSTYTTVSNQAPASLGFACINSITGPFSNPRLLAGCTLISGQSQPTTTTRILTSDDGAATWTPRAVPASWNQANIKNIIPADEFAVNDSAVVATGSVNNAILHSQDAGNTWTSVSMPMAQWSSDGYHVAYSPVHRLFLAVGADYEMAISDVGDSWSALSGINDESDLVNTDDDDRVRSLAAAGPCFAMAVNWLTATAGGQLTRRGVLYSFDLQGWVFVDFGLVLDGTGSNQLLGIKEWNGGFVVWSQNHAWFSPPLWWPDPDISRSA